MKNSFTLFFVVLITTLSYSQSEIPNKYLIKYVPTSHLDPFAQSLQLSVEQRLNGQYSIHYSLGYVYNANSRNAALSNIPKGYRSRVGLRYYKKGLMSNRFNFFHGPTLINRQTFLKTQMTICLSTDCSSTALVPFVEMQSRFGLTYGYGWNFISKNGFSLELEFLQGLVYRKYQNLGLPPLVNNPNLPIQFSEPNFFPFSSNDGFKLTAHILLKIGFAIPSK